VSGFFSAVIRGRRALFAAAAACGLAACGGDHGGSSGGTPTLTVTSPPIHFASSSQAGSPPPAILTAKVSGNPAKVYARTSSSGTASGVSSPQVSGATITATVTGLPGTSLPSATFTDAITLMACPDPDCNAQFAGSPATVLVHYIIGLDLGIPEQYIQVGGVEGKAPLPLTINATYYAGNGAWTAAVEYRSGTAGWMRSVPAAGSQLPTSFNLAVTAMPPGDYLGALSVRASASGAAAETTVLPVAYHVIPLLQYDVYFSPFAVTNAAAAAGQVRSTAITSADPARNVAWSATVAAGAPWLQLTSSTGNTRAGAASQLTMALVAAEIAKLRNGPYSAEILVTPDNGFTPITVPVTLTLDRSQVATVAPYVEPSGQATEVYLRGAHFDTLAIQSVQFGSQPAVTSFTIDGDSRIRVTSPALSAGSYPVTILVGGAAVDSTATLVVQDASDYRTAGSVSVPISFAQYAEFDPERHSCYLASTSQVSALRAGASAWTTQNSPATFTQIFGIALSADGRELLVGDVDQIVHLNPQTLAETQRAYLAPPIDPNGFGGLARVDDGTVVYVANGALWRYRPWMTQGDQDGRPVFGGALQSAQANRTGNRIAASLISNVSQFSISDSADLATPVLAFGATSLATFASDRFGARWVFSPLSSASAATVTDGSGVTLGSAPSGNAVALSDDGQTYVWSGLVGGVPTYRTYALGALPGGSAVLKGSVAAGFEDGDRLFLSPQQDQIISCGVHHVFATALP
jgi:hypothetical protein